MKFFVSKNRLFKSKNNKIVIKDQSDIYVKAHFDCTWDGLSKYCIFTTPNNQYHKIKCGNDNDIIVEIPQMLFQYAFCLISFCDGNSLITNKEKIFISYDGETPTPEVPGGNVNIDDLSLATVAYSGDYSDLSNIPNEFTPTAHTHMSNDILDLTDDIDENLDILLYKLTEDINRL